MWALTEPTRSAADNFTTGDHSFADGYLFLECRLERTVDGFGDNSLVIGRVVAAYADPESLRAFERDDAELIRDQPLLAYLYPQHFATIREGQTFPFPRGFSR